MNIAQTTTPLAASAEHLRSLHQAGHPLVLVNVWDAASARTVEAAGGLALGTSSAAIAASLGVPDDNSMEASLAFEAIRRIATSATVPISADLEGGYGLGASDLVEGLLAAGAVGCNLEDSDHARPGELLDAEQAAERLAEVRRAARRAGVDIVINARIDTFRSSIANDAAAAIDETLRRAHLYAEAGVDCVYPIGVTDIVLASRMANELRVAVNANLGPSTTVADMARAGVSRLSIGPTGHGWAMSEFGRRAEALLR